MAATADRIFWAFVWYAKHNPYKSMDNMTSDDFDAMVTGYALENSTELSAADPGTYTDVEYPGAITADNATTTTDQVDYPEEHFKKAKYGA